MKVKNHLKFCRFTHISNLQALNLYNLGSIAIKGNEIGVVIQIHDDENVRTDMFGNVHISEIQMASILEIEIYRPDIIKDIEDIDLPF